MVEENSVEKNESETETEAGSELEKTSDLEAVSPTEQSVEAQGNNDSEESQAAVVRAETPAVKAKTKQSLPQKDDELFLPWRPEPDHGSATRMLTDRGQAEVEIDGQGAKRRGLLNLTLVALMALVCAGAFTTLQQTDGFYSEEGAGLGGIINLKEAVARHQEQEHTYEELKKQKRFGSLTISSTPKGAMICTDKATLSRMNLDEKSKAALKKCPNANKRGDTLYQLTTAPGNINGIDIAHMLPLVAQREGYQDFPMYIGTHLWPVNQGNEAQYVRVFKMVPKDCNRWQTNDSQLGTLSFYSYMHCEQYTKGVKRKKNAARTTDGCVCKPEVVDLAKLKKKKKKSKSKK